MDNKGLLPLLQAFRIKLYLITFNNTFATREELTSYFDSNPELVKDWYYCFIDAMFVATEKSAKELYEVLLKRFGPKGRVFISEINAHSYYGHLTKDAWNFIEKYAKTYK